MNLETNSINYNDAKDMASDYAPFREAVDCSDSPSIDPETTLSLDKHHCVIFSASAFIKDII